MAFQVGTRVDPRLGALDFSGFTKAADIHAASLAQLGATIGGAITANKEKKQEKALEEQAANMVLSFGKNSETGKQLGIESLEDAKVVVKTLGGAKPALSLLMEIQEFQQGDPTNATQMTSIGRLLERPEFSNIKFDESGEPFMEIPNKDTFMFFDKKRIPVPESITSIPGFEDYAKSRRTSAVPEVNDNDPMGIF